MSLVMTGKTVFYGRPALYKITITLMNRDDFVAKLPLPLPSETEIMSIGQWMETGTHTTVSIHNNNESIAVSYKDILDAHTGVDPYHAYTYITVERNLDPTNTKPLPISEMADDLRRDGMDEMLLQRWLAEEVAYNQSQ